VSGDGDVGPGRFVAESYWPHPAAEDVRSAARRTRRAAAALPADAGRVRLLRCTLAPTDELCTWWFEADSVAAVVAVGQAVGLDFERVTPALDVWPGRRRG